MKRTIRITSMLLAIVMAVSFSACNDQIAVSRTDPSATGTTISSNVDSAEVSSDTETSKEETSSGTSSSKSETSSDTDSSESSATTTAVTTTTTNSTSSPKEEKTEEREVYDENGNVVDKIKVKVVDGVAYTVGEKSDDKCILDGVPIFTNDPEFPSGDVITMMQITLYNLGITISQKDIFEKYIEYHTPDEWYEENGIKYGPEITKLLQDPRLEPSKFENRSLGAVEKYCKKFFEEQGKNIYNLAYDFNDTTEFKIVKNLLLNEKLPMIQTTQPSDLVWEWMAKDLAGIEVQQGVFGGWESSVVIGYSGEKLITYDVSNGKIKYNEKKIIDVRSLEPRDAVE